MRVQWPILCCLAHVFVVLLKSAFFWTFRVFGSWHLEVYFWQLRQAVAFMISWVYHRMITVHWLERVWTYGLLTFSLNSVLIMCSSQVMALKVFTESVSDSLSCFCHSFRSKQKNIFGRIPHTSRIRRFRAVRESETPVPARQFGMSTQAVTVLGCGCNVTRRHWGTRRLWPTPPESMTGHPTTVSLHHCHTPAEQIWASNSHCEE